MVMDGRCGGEVQIRSCLLAGVYSGHFQNKELPGIVLGEIFIFEGGKTFFRWSEVCNNLLFLRNDIS